MMGTSGRALAAKVQAAVLENIFGELERRLVSAESTLRLPASRKSERPETSASHNDDGSSSTTRVNSPRAVDEEDLHGLPLHPSLHITNASGKPLLLKTSLRQVSRQGWVGYPEVEPVYNP